MLKMVYMRIMMRPMEFCHSFYKIFMKITFNKPQLKQEFIRNFTSSDCSETHHSCYLLVVGGGSGGCSIASKFVRKLGKGKVIVVEPTCLHYYQPMFTLVGAGVKDVKESVKPMDQVLPDGAVWIKDSVEEFDPDNNKVITKLDVTIAYDYLVIACGIVLNLQKVKGLNEALSMEDSGVCSNYLPEYAEKTFRVMKNLKEGNAVFNFPPGPVKCAGAPLKACYLAEHFTRIHNTRENVNFFFKTALPVIFAVKYYAGTLLELCQNRDIDIGFRKELVEIRPEKKEATFRLLDKTFELEKINYSMLHVTPPMSPPPQLKSAKMLTDQFGFLTIDKHTLQHVAYKNVFGLGDCTNLPTSKTAAAVATQANVVFQNLSLVMNGRPIGVVYNGYSSCPLLTGYGTCILAEFDYEHNPVETFPLDQRQERSLPYYLKRDIMPRIYWHLSLKGYWNGPARIRKLTHFGFG